MSYSIPGVFNVLDPAYGMVINGSRTGNAMALQAAIDAAQASGNPNGAIVLIPSVDPNVIPPYGSYPIGALTGGAQIITIPAPYYADAPLLICGTGNGTQLTMQTPEASSGQTILFDVADTANVIFQDLTVKFVEAEHGEKYSQTGIAFNFRGGAGHRLFRVNVLDCQYPVVINETDGVTLLQCELTYTKEGFSSDVTAVTAVQIQGAATQTSIAQCILNYLADKTYTTTFVGIQIAESAFTTLRDTQCLGFGQGVVIGDGSSDSTPAVNTAFAGVRISSGGPVITIKPLVFDVSFVDCHFQADGSYTGSGPGIEIGQSGDTNKDIDTVRFTGCTLIGNYGLAEGSPPGAYGMQINAGQNIQVNGGKYSGCGATAGITIAGATEVQIIGASCIGLEYGLETGSTPEPLYQLYGIMISAGQDIQILNVNCSGSGTLTDPGYGIYIAPAPEATISNVKIIGAICTNPVLEEAGSSIVMQECGVYAKSVSNLLIQGCALTGNSVDGIYLEGVSEATAAACDLYGNEQGIYVGNGCSSVFIRDNNISGYASLGAAISFASSSELTEVEVTDCAGYNDQAAVLFGPSAAPSAVFSGVSLAGYYGPATFYLSLRPQSVKIDGHVTSLSSGAFDLGPGEYAQVLPTGLPGTLLMIGT